MELQVMVNGVTRWGGEFVDKATGEVVKGTPYTKLFFTSKSLEEKTDRHGYFEGNYKGDYKLFEIVKTKQLPCQLTLVAEIKPDSKGNATVWITGVK